MYYKQYGNTDMKVSAIGLGTMRYDEEDIAAGRLEKCAEIPLYAFEKGINYWDTAPFYCDDKSEIVTGIALSQVKRSDVYVTSKTNFNTIGQNPTRDDFRRRLEMSLQRLQTDYIDFYHMWCMLNLESWERHMEVIYRFFEEAKAEGLIRNIVFSSHMEGNDIEKVVDTGKFKGMLIGYNALNYRFRQSGIEAAHAKGMGVVVRLLLKRYLDVETIDFSVSERGKPYHKKIAGKQTVDFNISHSGEFILAGFAVGMDIGVDVQEMAGCPDYWEIAGNFYTEEEAEDVIKEGSALFFQYWAAKEAYVKALGIGLGRGMDFFSVRNGEIIEKGRNDQGWFLYPVRIKGYAAYVAVHKKGDKSNGL